MEAVDLINSSLTRIHKIEIYMYKCFDLMTLA